jgi:DNA-directed RNA polymerase sigma subunit (sigma70/sigma32)
MVNNMSISDRDKARAHRLAEIYKVRLEGKLLKEVGNIFNITGERVRCICNSEARRQKKRESSLRFYEIVKAIADDSEFKDLSKLK